MNAEEERFRYLYDKNYHVLRKIARKRGIPEDEADDAVQETFVSYYTHYPLTWSDLHARLVLIKIMRNLCVDYLRRKDRHPVEIYDSGTLEKVISSGTGRLNRDTLEIVMEHIWYGDLLEALKEMKQEQLTVFVMYVIQGRTMEEISETVGASVAACRMRLTRARKHLESRLRIRRTSAENRPAGLLSGKPVFDGPSEEE